MKSLSLGILFTLISASVQVQAATIFEIKNGVSLFANSVAGSSGDYYDQSFTDFSSSTPATASELTADVAGNDLTKYAWTPNAHLPSTSVSDAYIDLGFARDIYNGAGADLVLFFAGNGTRFKDNHIEPYQFSIDVGADGTNEGGLFGVTTSTTSSIYGDSFFASYALIDLDDYGFDRTTALGNIRIHLGDSSMPSLAALGAYHDSPTVVPLPLSAVLFSSGLALLGWTGRRKKI